jgi:hypothetical protein
MGVPTTEVGYTSVTTGRGDHEVHKGHVGTKETSEIRSYTTENVGVLDHHYKALYID